MKAHVQWEDTGSLETPTSLKRMYPAYPLACIKEAIAAGITNHKALQQYDFEYLKRSTMNLRKSRSKFVEAGRKQFNARP